MKLRKGVKPRNTRDIKEMSVHDYLNLPKINCANIDLPYHFNILLYITHNDKLIYALGKNDMAEYLLFYVKAIHILNSSIYKDSIIKPIDNGIIIRGQFKIVEESNGTRVIKNKYCLKDSNV